MRQKDRIKEILDLINSIWESEQDMRFFQLMYLIQTKYSKINSNYGKIEVDEKGSLPKVGFDFFNLEDDLLIEFLKDIKKNNGIRK